MVTSNPTVPPSEVDALYRKHRLRVMLAITLGYGFIYTCRLGLSIVKKPLIDGGVFTVEELGMVGSALFTVTPAENFSTVLQPIICGRESSFPLLSLFPRLSTFSWGGRNFYGYLWFCGH
jgi:hypothetical protein